jgi:chromosome segregation ATPase
MLKKINLDGIEYEAEESVIKALNAEKARADKAEKDACEEKKTMDKKVADMEKKVTELEKRISEVEAERDTAKDKADSAEKELEEIKKTSMDSKKIDEMVNAKIDLLHNAEKAGVEVKSDMADADIKKAVIAKVFPNAKFDGKDDVYVQARYDATIEILAERADQNTKTFTSDMPPANHADENDARERMIQRMKNHGKEEK